VDERLRASERGAATGDRSRAEALQQRVRAGLLSPERVELAAALGDPIALELRPEVERVPWAPVLRDQATILQALRSAAALLGDERLPVRFLIDLGERVLALGSERASRAALRAARAWLDCPCPEHSRAAGDAAAEVSEAEIGLDQDDPTWALASYARGAATAAAAAACGEGPPGYAFNLAAHGAFCAAKATPDPEAECVWQAQRLAQRLLESDAGPTRLHCPSPEVAVTPTPAALNEPQAEPRSQSGLERD